MGSSLVDKVICRGNIFGVAGGEEVEEGLGETYYEPSEFEWFHVLLAGMRMTRLDAADKRHRRKGAGQIHTGCSINKPLNLAAGMPWVAGWRIGRHHNKTGEG